MTGRPLNLAGLWRSVQRSGLVERYGTAGDGCVEAKSSPHADPNSRDLLEKPKELSDRGRGFGRYVEGVVLTSWLGERARGVVDLRTLASKGTARGEAIKANIAFIDSERDRLRALLFSAAMDEKLPYNDGPILDVFIANGGKEATAEELDALDMIEVD